MKCLVVYYSRGGKTAKVAGAIAGELGCEVCDISKGAPDVSGVDLLVVGSGTYGGNPGPSLSEFLQSIPESVGGKAAVFATSAGPKPKSLPKMSSALEKKGYKVVSSFDCRGQFLVVNRGHPDEKDLENARAFARDLKNK
ncbi:MAG: flavodoxin domain-containing protein [Candidatus Verstraetearchaeota archaeon]|nr:flavodoxin domain-containing protein [Candidatus Verstraetearchaeota archaeon]